MKKKKRRGRGSQTLVNFNKSRPGADGPCVVVRFGAGLECGALLLPGSVSPNYGALNEVMTSTDVSNSDHKQPTERNTRQWSCREPDSL